MSSGEEEGREGEGREWGERGRVGDGGGEWGGKGREGVGSKRESGRWGRKMRGIGGKWGDGGGEGEEEKIKDMRGKRVVGWVCEERNSDGYPKEKERGEEDKEGIEEGD